MKRRRKTLLGVALLLLVAVVAAVGAAVAGWLPPVNRWAERRIVAELRGLGIERGTARVQELSWRRAVVGPVELHLSGLELRAEEVRVELGWAVWRRRADPQVVLRRVDLELGLDRLEEVRKALRSDGGEFPVGRIAVEQSRIALRKGTQRWELPVSGLLESKPARLQVNLHVQAAWLAGRIQAIVDGAGETLEVELREGRIDPAAWPLLAEVLPPALASGLTDLKVTTASLLGEARVVAGQFDSGTATLTMPSIGWRKAANCLEGRDVRLQWRKQPRQPWQAEIKANGLAVEAEAGRVQVTAVEGQIAPGAAELRFGVAELSGLGGRVVCKGRGQATLDSSMALATAQANLQVTSAGCDPWATTAPFDLAIRWDGARLEATAGPLAVAGAGGQLQFSETEATCDGLREGRLQVAGHARLETEPLAWLGGAAKGWELQPLRMGANLSFLAMLEAGRESVRVDFDGPAKAFALRWPGGALEASLGLKGAVTVDRNLISGQVQGEASALVGRHGDWAGRAEGAAARLQIPRTWRKALEAWAALPTERRWREGFWIADGDFQVTGARLDAGADRSVTGLSLRVRSRGAEVSEGGGVELSATADALRAAGLTVRDIRGHAVGGLEQLALDASAQIDGFPAKLALAQQVRWSDGFEVAGTFGFPEAECAGAEPWAQHWPAMKAVEIAGAVGVSGRNRFAGGRWSAAAEIGLRNLGIRWPETGNALEGIAGRLELTSLWPLRTAAAQRLEFTHGKVGDVAVHNGAAVFALEAGERLNIEKLEAEVFGGRAAAGGFTVDLRQPAFVAPVRVSGAKLNELLRLFRDVPAEASGAVEGEIPVGWKDGRVTVGTGQLSLQPGEIGRVRFTRDLQPLTGGRSRGTFQYRTLRKIETAILELHFDRLRIDTYPANTPGRSLQVRLMGVPIGSDVSAPVSFDLNVNAPIENFLNWSLLPNLQLSGIR